MAYNYTADELILDVQARGMLAPSSNTLSNADYLRFINDEIQTYLVPFLMSTKSDYFVATSDVSVTAGTSTYAIPTRAIGAKLRQVSLLVGSNYTPMSQIEPEQLVPDIAAVPGFYIEGNSIVLYPTPTSSTTLRLKYFMRPSRVVLVSETGIVTGTPTTTVDVTSAPSGWATGATDYDLVKGTPHFECRAIDQSATRASNTLTFGTAIAGLTAGDYVCLAGESPVPQLPVEVHPLLAERVVFRALKALGDPRAELTEASSSRMRADLERLLKPRVEAASRYAINLNAPGWSRTGYTRRR